MTKITSKLFRAFLRFFFRYVFKLHLSGWELDEKNILIISNHISYLDGLIIWYLYDYPIEFLYRFNKALVVAVKIFGYICGIKLLHIRKIKTALQKLRNGETIVIFPEGRINYTNKLFLPFKPGWKFLSKHSQVPIYRVDIRRVRREFYVRIDRMFDGYRKRYE